MNIDTTYLRRCIGALEAALCEIGKHREMDGVAYEISRAACVEEFELALEQCGKLLRKRLTAFFPSNQQADRLTFKNLFVHAARHGLIDVDAAERWISYRDNRSDTTHDYGQLFAETTLKLLPDFIADAGSLADIIGRHLMTDRLHLLPRHRHILDSLLREHLPGVEVWTYGSRVNGRSHDGSDLDLVLRGPDLKEIPITQLVDFEEALQDSHIPFIIEARDWARIPDWFYPEIERKHVTLVSARARRPRG